MVPDSAAAHEAIDVPGALWRRRWLIVVLTLIGAAAALVASMLSPTVYASTTKVVIEPTALNPPGSVPLASTISLPTDAELVRSQPVLAAAAEALGGDTTEAGLGARVSAATEIDSQVVAITVQAPTAEGARDGADAVAEAYLAYRAEQAIADAQRAIAQAEEQLVGLRAKLDEATEAQQRAPAGSPAATQATNEVAQLNGQIAIWENAMSMLNVAAVDPGSVIVPAPLPAAPTSPDRTQDLVRGALAGLLVGLVVGLALEARANTRRRAAP